MQAGCTPEEACGLNVDAGDDLGSQYEVEMSALVEVPATTPTSSAAGAGDAGDEFETAVALWLGVDAGDVSVSSERLKSEKRRLVGVVVDIGIEGEKKRGTW